MFKKKDPNLIYFEKEAKRRKRKERVERGFEFVKDNWVWLSGAIPAGVVVTKYVGKVVVKGMQTYRTNAEIRFKERTIYDHSLGRYVELKRPLTSDQALSIERRRSEGERLHMILDDMNLLKR